MVKQIRYAWGSSSLGDFLAAVSEKGLVAFAFADCREAALDALQVSAPETSLVEDSAGLSAIVRKLALLIDHPESDPGIALDPHGSDYQKQVWSLLQEVPAGQTTSYGALAAKLGTRERAT